MNALTQSGLWCYPGLFTPYPAAAGAEGRLRRETQKHHQHLHELPGEAICLLLTALPAGDAAACCKHTRLEGVVVKSRRGVISPWPQHLQRSVLRSCSWLGSFVMALPQRTNTPALTERTALCIHWKMGSHLHLRVDAF